MPSKFTLNPYIMGRTSPTCPHACPFLPIKNFIKICRTCIETWFKWLCNLSANNFFQISLWLPIIFIILGWTLNSPWSDPMSSYFNSLYYIKLSSNMSDFFSNLKLKLIDIKWTHPKHVIMVHKSGQEPSCYPKLQMSVIFLQGVLDNFKHYIFLWNLNLSLLSSKEQIINMIKNHSPSQEPPSPP